MFALALIAFGLNDANATDGPDDAPATSKPLEQR
jgi:hypothetical protein